ncbi:MAG: PQQ-dependent sugar dehydrogenase [Acidobacteria bacterium]|nr:PQQ-dependent sugar dehydrogenase [Acidobacteriota bacterium]
MRSRSIISVFVFVVVFAVSSVIFAQSSAPPFRLDQNFISGLSSPLLATHAGDGTHRLFIVERGGVIKVVQPGSRTTSNFLTITSRIVSGGERGLLGLAFHPNFASNGYFFVNYTRTGDGATVVSRFKAINGNTVGDPNSERILLTISQPFTNHNGGMIGFREDRPGEYNLYIGTGDGGSANDPGNRAQNVNERLGKFLRITPDVSIGDADPIYTIPSDNPYASGGGAAEIYAVGLRNPWRWSFDRETGQIWAADVGQDAIEEVSLIDLAKNYGWRVYEGNQCTGLDPGLCNPANFEPPIFQYTQTSARCSITGGYVYRGVQNALPRGAYIYGDYCSGEIFKYDNGQHTLLTDTNRNISSFGEGENGELYVVGLGGTVDRIMGNRTSADFDGDLRTDVSVFRPSDAYWYMINSGSQTSTVRQFGAPGDIPVTEDYDGDLKADSAVFRPSNGTWYMLRSTDFTYTAGPFGSGTDIPVPGDFDGDGKADMTVYRPSSGVWYSFRSSDFQVTITTFGISEDIPVAGDYDGDGTMDIAVWRPSTGVWYIRHSSNGSVTGALFGLSTDRPVTGDMDGDLKNDIIIYRPNTGYWYILRSSDQTVQTRLWGISEDIPVTGDYDGDFRDDIAVFRPSTGAWYILQSSNGTMQALQFGLPTDIPLPSVDTP